MFGADRVQNALSVGDGSPIGGSDRRQRKAHSAVGVNLCHVLGVIGTTINLEGIGSCRSCVVTVEVERGGRVWSRLINVDGAGGRIRYDCDGAISRSRERTSDFTDFVGARVNSDRYVAFLVLDQHGVEEVGRCRVEGIWERRAEADKHVENVPRLIGEALSDIILDPRELACHVDVPKRLGIVCEGCLQGSLRDHHLGDGKGFV